jgi:hypothetical protein
MQNAIHETVQLRGDKVEANRNVQRTYTKMAIDEQGTDFAYWQTQSYQARLATLEQIRQEYHRWQYGVEPRFQRVYRIIKR